MTNIHYTSKDKIVQIVTTTDDARYPRHQAPMVVIKLRPKPHTRCREQWGGITLMLTHEEVKAILDALKACDPKFDFWLSKASKNKPEAQTKFFRNFNRRRLSKKGRYV